MMNTTLPSQSFPQRLVAAWYAFASPPIRRREENFTTRNADRRSQTSSWLILVVILLVLAPIPGALSRPFVLIPVGIAFLIDTVAFFLNRQRRTTTAGIILIVTITLGLVGTLLSVPGGIGPADLPLFDLLAQSVIVSAYMIGPNWAFVLAAVNCLLIWLLLHGGRVSPEVSHLLAANGNIFTQAVEVQVILALFAYVLVFTSNLAIRNLDRSEAILELERKEIERQQTEIERNAQLEVGMQTIQAALSEAANGKFNARAQLSQENVLWRLAYSLNTLLARLQSDRQNELNLRHITEHISHLEQAVHASHRLGQPIQAKLGRTPLDAVIILLNGKILQVGQRTDAVPPTSQSLPQPPKTPYPQYPSPMRRPGSN